MHCLLLYVLLEVGDGWSIWVGWSECSVTCGYGNRSRSRTCTSLGTYKGGLRCLGHPNQYMPCNESMCLGKFV